MEDSTKNHYEVRAIGLAVWLEPANTGIVISCLQVERVRAYSTRYTIGSPAQIRQKRRIADIEEAIRVFEACRIRHEYVGDETGNG